MMKHWKTNTDKIINAAFQTILDSTSDMIFVKDASLTYVAASMPFAKMVGKQSVDEIQNHTDFEIFEDRQLAARYVADDHTLLASKKPLINYIEPLPDDHGRARYGSTSKYILKDSENNILGIIGITKDITREYIARQHYQQELKHLFELPKDTFAAVFIDIDSWRIISQRRQLVNKGTMQSCHTIEALCEFALASFAEPDCVAAAFYRDFSQEQLKAIYKSGKRELSFRYLRHLSDHSLRWVQNEIRFLIDQDNGHLCVMLTARDVDTATREELDLAVSAKMDKMTMLFNRETTLKKIRETLSEMPDRFHALFMIDLDNFKSLNDTYGHQAGDEFLIRIAEILKNNFRESDIVGRIGGDEFFALMKDISDRTDAENKAVILIAAIEKGCQQYPFLNLSASIGISLYPIHGTTVEELYAQADRSLYQAKKNGKNQFQFSI